MRKLLHQVNYIWVFALIFTLITPSAQANADDDNNTASASNQTLVAQSLVQYFDQNTHQVEKAEGKTQVLPAYTTSPTGYSPAQIQNAYQFPTSTAAGRGKTIAIIDAGGYSPALKDLNTFSRTFGLPQLSTCPTTVADIANLNCFRQVNQTGGSRLPPRVAGWDLEIDLDLQWAHAMAPGASILYVPANTNTFNDMFLAIQYAKKNADYISMSWTGGEGSWVLGFDSYFNNPINSFGRPVSFYAASGDAGAALSYPASSTKVVAVGGTTLVIGSSGTVTETGWVGSGGGCSGVFSPTTAQASFLGASNPCSAGRPFPDVSLVADPYTGVSVYQPGGWAVVGGTSVSSPVWAGRSAATGVAVNSNYIYSSTPNITYRDITVGNNGGYTCRVGYDLVTGRGSWVGVTP